MPAPVIPTKTPLGQEELRRRTGGLGQRHRTILFLIDGKRPLSEVLSLAQAAGAATSHFEDLVRLGYVEMPPEAPPEEPPVAAPAEAAELTHVELTVPAEDAPTEPMPMPEPVAETVLVPAVAPEVVAPEGVVPEVAVPAVVPPSRAPAAPAPVAPPPVTPPPVRTPVAQAAAQAIAPEPDEPLSAVRRCLLETLRLDLTPFSFRAQSRVRDAADTQALIDIVWAIEADLPQTRRSRAGLLSLQRAREMLGLGNTLVDEDSQSGKLDDDDW